MSSRARATRVLMRFVALAFLACAVEPALPLITRLAVYRCSNTDCTELGARLEGLPPRSGQFMVGAWFRGTQDVHWTIRWITDSVGADFTHLQDSSIVSANLDGMLFTTALVLSVRLRAGGSDSLTWDFR